MPWPNAECGPASADNQCREGQATSVRLGSGDAELTFERLHQLEVFLPRELLIQDVKVFLREPDTAEAVRAVGQVAREEHVGALNAVLALHAIRAVVHGLRVDAVRAVVALNAAGAVRAPEAPLARRAEHAVRAALAVFAAVAAGVARVGRKHLRQPGQLVEKVPLVERRDEGPSFFGRNVGFSQVA